MTMFVCWLVFPVVLSLLSIGCGFLAESVSSVRLPGTLLLPLGFCVIIAVAGLATISGATASLAIPAVVALAAAGLLLRGSGQIRRIAGWPLAAAAGAFAVYGAPVVLSGRATFAGYISLDDSATFWAFADRVFEHGRSLAGLAPSSYEATLSINIGQGGYPIGSVLPLGVGAKLVGQDLAWVYQPYLAFQAAMLALVLWALLGRIVASPRLRALSAFVAAQAALLYGYSLWGSVKELVTAPIVALLAALVLCLLREPGGVRSVLPLAIATSAALDVLNVGAGVWVGLALLPALGLATRVSRRAFALRVAAFATFALVLSIPMLQTASTFVTPASQALLNGSELGNLIHPLSGLQLFGIWPVGDFRTRPGNMDATYVLVTVLLLAAAWALVQALRRGAWELLLYVVLAGVGCAVLTSFGSPWIDGKVLATASPAFVLAGMAGAAAAFERGRRVEAVLVGAAIAGGVLWSNVLAYHDVWLAPRSQLSELETIGKRFAGDGPTLMTEYQPYGVRHFLRNMDPESAGELRRRLVLLRNGGTVGKGAFADIDDFRLDQILVYRTLLLNRSPVASRPPSIYRLVWRGRYYEAWQRPATGTPPILEHLSLGNDAQPVATPSCTEVMRLAGIAARAGGRLAAVVREPAVVFTLSSATYPGTWPAGSGLVYPESRGTLEADVQVPKAARYDVWVGGSFAAQLTAVVDGQYVGNARDKLNHPGQYVPMGQAFLTAGAHKVTLRYSGPDLHPGSGARLFLPMGPLVLGRTTADLPVTYVSAKDARFLCGKDLDWIEALGA